MAARIRLNNAQIRALTMGGDVYDYVEDTVGPAVLREIKARTPIRSGNMHRKMQILDVVPGPRETTVRVGARGIVDSKGKPYIHKVIRGTGGHGVQFGGDGKNYPIGFALMGDGVPFGQVNRRPGKSAPGVPTLFAKNFRGQAPNNFMQEGLRAAMRKLGLR
jgi:hypothetical protein